jgi:hypothetical protein
VPLELDAVACGVREPAGEVDAFGHEQREMVEARVEQRSSPAAERERAVADLDRLEPDGRSVVGERSLEIRDAQVHGSEPGEGRELRRRLGGLSLELLWVAWSFARAQFDSLVVHGYCS